MTFTNFMSSNMNTCKQCILFMITIVLPCLTVSNLAAGGCDYYKHETRGGLMLKHHVLPVVSLLGRKV
jgi:hypothetical protein